MEYLQPGTKISSSFHLCDVKEESNFNETESMLSYKSRSFQENVIRES